MALILLVGITVFFLFKTSLSAVDYFFLPRLASDSITEPIGSSAAPADTPSSPTHTGIASAVPSALMDIPVVTPPPSETPVFLESVHVYEVTKLPPGASQGLLVHIVAQGETLDLLAAYYGTTVQAILSVNYGLTPPAWVDYPIVIPVDTKDAAGLPSFKVYVVKDYETISAETLANILAVDVKDLEYYNVCGANCQFSRGDVLLIPHMP